MANDYGKLKGNIMILKAKIFPYEKKEDSEIINGLEKLSHLGFIQQYISKEENFILITNWSKTQTLTYKGRDEYPSPDKIKEISIPKIEKAFKTTGFRQGDLEIEDQDVLTPLFEEFWKEYPRKLGKKAAFIKWEILKKEKIDLMNIIGAAKNYSNYVLENEFGIQFVMYAEKFLNPKKERWKDFLKSVNERRPSLPAKPLPEFQGEDISDEERDKVMKENFPAYYKRRKVKKKEVK